MLERDAHPRRRMGLAWWLVPALLLVAACSSPGDGGSGLPWKSGSWVNGGGDRLRRFEAMRGRPADAVTQSLRGKGTWAEHAGAASEADVDREFRQPPSDWASSPPSFAGIFEGSAWMSHVWGGYPATEHRRRIIHLAWMGVVPRAVGNRWQGGRYTNPSIWRQIREGAADKYMFLLGRKFAYLDQKYGDTNHPMTIDLGYEWTLTSHRDLPEGSYWRDGVKHYTYQDFPYGWSRLVRVFKEGYEYQRGRPCDYRFSWRPQLRFVSLDRADPEGNRPVRHEELWPNLAQGWVIPADVVIDGVTVLPAGPIGRAADIVAVSWHDSSKEQVRGASIDEPGSNWRKILGGFPTHWGLQEVADFARQQGVLMAFPEWAARGASHPPPSARPGDVYRFTFAFFQRNADVLAYETVFDQGSGNLYRPWSPAPPSPEQDPLLVYRELWGSAGGA